MPDTNDHISGKPSKAFFIDMITRDLGITDCILDLVDNAIDHAVTTSKVDVMTSLTNGHRPKLRRFYVAITLSGNSFTIEDNCGGISVDDAQTRVFRFGDPQSGRTEAGLSVYGIGMKRAFFKLGNVIRVQSATAAEWFVVDINVNAWKALGDDKWDFKFREKGRLSPRRQKYPAKTTKITVSGLHEEVTARFNDPSFNKQLRRRLGSTYGLFLSAGLDISVNHTRIEPELPSIGSFAKLVPARHELRTDGVRTLIIAGVTPRDDRRPHGWYVFCNGRTVLEADRSRLTGWGENLPQWHSKYGHFAGYVYFRSSDVRALPWTTTKQSVVYESAVYQAALAEMQVQARPILNFLNNLYPDDVVEDEVAEREILTKARGIPLTQLPRKETRFAARVTASKKADALVSIQYQKPRKLVEKVKQRIGRARISAGAVGNYTFDYYVRQEIE